MREIEMRQNDGSDLPNSARSFLPSLDTLVETRMRRYRANPSRDLGDALDLVAGLIARYEAEHFEMPTARPTEILNLLLAESDLDQQELAKRLEISSSHMSNVLNGTRQITVELARKLAQIFSRPATLFLNL